MSKNKHTPGPWKFSSESMRVYFVDSNGEEPPICAIDVNDIMSIQCPDTIEANARLIAAAPTQYAQISEYLGLFEEIKATEDQDDKRLIVERMNSLRREMIATKKGIDNE